MSLSRKLILVLALVAVAALVWWAVGEVDERGSTGGARTNEELAGLAVPKVDDEPPEEGVGVPGKIAEGESGNPEQQYWVFETELKNGVLDPFEFRVPVGDLLGISVKNGEPDTQTVYIEGTSAFVPNFIEREVAPGDTASMRTQVLEVGEYAVKCRTCSEEIIGKFVVVPRF